VVLDLWRTTHVAGHAQVDHGRHAKGAAITQQQIGPQPLVREHRPDVPRHRRVDVYTGDAYVPRLHARQVANHDARVPRAKTQRLRQPLQPMQMRRQ
jgi:hypothetical protein